MRTSERGKACGLGRKCGLTGKKCGGGEGDKGNARERDRREEARGRGG